MWAKLHNELRTEVDASTADRWFANAKLGADFLRHGKDAEGRLLFAVSRDGRTPLHFQRKPYAAVFYIQGCIEYGEAVRVRGGGSAEAEAEAAHWLDEAADYFERLRGWIGDPRLLGRVAPPPAEGDVSVLADVMCLSSLSEELLHKLPQRRDELLAHVQDAQRRVRCHFDPARRVFMEAARPGDGVNHATAAGRLFNPGHSIEVAWFVLRLCRLRPDPELRQIALEVLEGSLQRGWDEQQGGLWYMLDILGRPLADCTVTAEHKLWWPVTEALYACTLALEETADPKWLGWLRRVHAFAYERLCDAEGGGEWFGYLRPDGSVFNACKGGAYKGFFHVPRALLLAVRSAEAQLRAE